MRNIARCFVLNDRADARIIESDFERGGRDDNVEIVPDAWIHRHHAPDRLAILRLEGVPDLDHCLPILTVQLAGADRQWTAERGQAAIRLVHQIGCPVAAAALGIEHREIHAIGDVDIVREQEHALADNALAFVFIRRIEKPGKKHPGLDRRRYQCGARHGIASKREQVLGAFFDHVGVGRRYLD